ncbi:hypothetical protein B0O80DRAFT_497585 [Mortierella sp. GBAus27b]|nr:hypothetical protein B0O80DRAFT_497585 [Mortierella sp. GBAus27b]
MSIEYMHQHLQSSATTPENNDHSAAGRYVLTGLFRTNGHRIQSLAYNTEGNDALLGDVRNWFSSEGEVRATIGSDGTDVNVLALNLGEAFTTEKAREIIPKEPKQDESPTTVAEIESSFPARRGQYARLAEAAIVQEQYHEALNDIYYDCGCRHARHEWDSSKARQAEFDLMCHSPVNSDDWGITWEEVRPGYQGRHWDRTGSFKTHTKLSSVHSGFASHFIRKARWLDYLVVGINEFLISKQCPVCGPNSSPDSTGQYIWQIDEDTVLPKL